MLFDALLHPHRSLSRRGFWLLMGGFALISMAIGTVFLLQGAWPVFGFFGLDVLLFYLAFQWTYRTGGAHERIKLTEREITVRQVDHRGRARTHSFQPSWLRVDVRPGLSQGGLTLASHGQHVLVGSFLTPAERHDLADALREALERMRTPLAPGAS